MSRLVGLLCVLASCILAVSAAVLPERAASAVHLAVSPNCGTLSGPPADVNAGLGPLTSFRTIVAFGDSYTDGGVDNGSPLKPAVVSPPNPFAGGRWSNGPVWVEALAEAANATLKDYATAGAVIDATQWPNTDINKTNDFYHQVELFTSKNTHLEAETTLYVLFFGMEDFIESIVTNQTDLSYIAQSYVWEILTLSSSPIGATNFLLVDNYGRGVTTPAGEAFKQDIFTALGTGRRQLDWNVGFVSFVDIWQGVLGSNPGYSAFGYTDPGTCTVSSDTTVDACADPDHTFYWIGENPTTATHSILAEYVEEVLTQCQSS